MNKKENNILYPTDLIIKGDINPCPYSSIKENNCFVDSKDAIKIVINVSGTEYRKSDMKKALSEVFQKVLQYYE